MMALKNTVKECREGRHINQQQLADYTGTTRETINRLEADFLVNAGEHENDRKAVSRFRETVFQTRTGRKLLDDMYDEGRM